MMLKIGLTGSIGSGKTLVSKIFQTLGAPVFHADEEAKKLYLLPTVKKELFNLAGPEIFNKDGNIDRKGFADRIFRDESLLTRVNAFIHPLVRKAFTEKSLSGGHAYILYEAAILMESGYSQDLDGLIVVHAPEELRFKRVMERDGATRDQVMSRARFQFPDEIKLQAADWVIHNDETRLVIPQVIEIDRVLKQRSG